MDSVPNSPDMFVCEVPEVGKTEICFTKRHVHGWRCSFEMRFPF
jgi:hypothetical protein